MWVTSKVYSLKRMRVGGRSDPLLWRGDLPKEAIGLFRGVHAI